MGRFSKKTQKLLIKFPGLATSGRHNSAMITDPLRDVSFPFLANVLRYVRYMISQIRLSSVCRLSVTLVYPI